MAKRSGPRFTAMALRSLLVAVIAVAAAFAAPSVALAAHFHWLAPALVDTQPTQTDGIAIESVSCPAATLCVAGDDLGNVFTSSNPSGGRTAWTKAAVDPSTSRLSNRILGISCPGVSLCVASDSSGNVLTSTHPAGGLGSWSVANVDGSLAIEALSCPSTALCVAVDQLGDVLTSTNPTGGAPAWSTANIDGSNILQAVSCPSASFCAAVDPNGNVLVSTNPTGGASHWTASNIDGSNALFSISCPSSSFCAAGDSQGNVLTSTNPTGGAPAWASAAVSPGAGLKAVSCLSASFCVAGGNHVYSSTNPTGGAGAWTAGHGDAIYGLLIGLDGASCPSTTLCVAVDGGGFVVTSSDATAGNHWTGGQIDGTPSLYGVSCPSRSLCFADDDAGNVLYSTRPAGGPSAWTAVNVGATQSSAQLYGLSCPTGSLCIAPADFGPLGTSGSGGYGLVSTNPRGPGRTWRPFYLLHGVNPVQHGFFAVACASRSLCAVMQDDGKLFVATHPTRARSWSKRRSRGQRRGVFCPAGGRCVAPVGSCPMRTLCVDLAGVGDGGVSGRIAVSTNPAGGARTWRSFRIDRRHSLDAVSCPTSRLCVAVDDAGNALISTHPVGGVAAWHLFHIDDAALEAVSCSSASFCAAVDRSGQVVIGTRTG